MYIKITWEHWNEQQTNGDLFDILIIQGEEKIKDKWVHINNRGRNIPENNRYQDNAS